MNFTQHNTFASLANLKDDWNHLLEKNSSQVPFLTFDYLEAWWKTCGGGEWPENSELVLITAFQDEKLVGIAPLFHANNLLGKPALMFIGAIEVSDFLDFIVQPGYLQPFISGLLDFLATADSIPSWEVLDLYNILEDSPTIEALEEEAEKRNWPYNQAHLQPSPYIPLPGDFDAYLAGIDKKQRHEIRRKLRNMAQSPAEDGFYIVSEGDDLYAETEAFIDMMAQDPSKQDFLTDAMRQHLHNTAEAAFYEGWLQLSFFTIDGQKAAGNMSFLYNNRLWLYNSGWEWEFRYFSPGWLLLSHLLQWANENGIEEFDFMRGDEDYKYKFGGIDRHIYRVTVTH